eukprot:COSAG04_NODE_13_length_42806_cov_92.030323_25_plen_54_part_00
MALYQLRNVDIWLAFARASTSGAKYWTPKLSGFLVVLLTKDASPSAACSAPGL